MPWYQSFPPADAYVPCAGQWHEIQFHNGELQLPGHPDAEAELVLAALGGDIPECVEVAQAWNHRKTDVGLLMVLPRSAQDRITVSWNDVETFESPQRGAVTLSGGAAMSIPTSLPPNAPPRLRQMRDEALRGRARHLELLRLLALGHEFQVRLAGCIAANAGDASPGGSKTPGESSPALAAALAGRAAPVVARWLDINPDDVTVAVHEGPGWGSVFAADDEAWVALPVSWLWEVWACGVELADGQLVVAVNEPGWPEARVLALREPGEKPVEFTAHRGPH
ncbi:MAG: hypothetical protein ABSA93_27790 [Streptosporangiaceae bacterium]|jgi:hypothetical protein